jgi:hypothetical protein
MLLCCSQSPRTFRVLRHYMHHLRVLVSAVSMPVQCMHALLLLEKPNKRAQICIWRDKPLLLLLLLLASSCAPSLSVGRSICAAPQRLTGRPEELCCLLLLVQPIAEPSICHSTGGSIVSPPSALCTVFATGIAPCLASNHATTNSDA